MERSTHLRSARRASKSVSVWYSPDDLGRLEQASVLAGYVKLSTYVRERSLGRARYDDAVRKNGLDSIATDELVGRIEQLEDAAQTQQALLTLLVGLVARKSTAADVNELVAVCDRARSPIEALELLRPELAAALSRWKDSVE